MATVLQRAAAAREKAEEAKRLLGNEQDECDLTTVIGSLETAADPLSLALAKFGRAVDHRFARSKVA